MWFLIQRMESLFDLASGSAGIGTIPIAAKENTMKLSYALKKGSKGMKQIQYRYSTCEGVCALGAIARGLNVPAANLKSYTISSPMWTMIAHMNDDEDRSFNYIRNWLIKRGL